MKKILVFTTGNGTGRDIAAAHLVATLKQLAPRQAEVIFVRSQEEAGLKARLGFAFRGEPVPVPPRLPALLDQISPDTVVITEPESAAVPAPEDRNGRLRDFTLVALVTLPIAPGSAWSRVPADYFSVVDPASAAALRGDGIPEEKIRVFGFPLPLEPEASSKKNLPAAGVLWVWPGAGKKSAKLWTRLTDHPEWQVTLLAEDHDAAQKLRDRMADVPDHFKIVEGSLAEQLARHRLAIGPADSAVLHQAIQARCPFIAYRVKTPEHKANLDLLREANSGAVAEKARDVAKWIERAFQDEGRLLAFWRNNLERLRQPDSAQRLAHFVLELAAAHTSPKIYRLPAPEPALAPNGRPEAKRLLLVDLHSHTTWSDGRLTVPEIVDFYGQRGFDCLCITDHLCDPKRLLGKLVNFTGLVIAPDRVAEYFAAIEQEKQRAWEQYELLLMTGIEFNKDGYTAKSSTHLLGVDLKKPIDPTLDLRELIVEIHAQGGLAIASHPHETKGAWGKDTLHLWERVEEYAPLLDAWEVANRDDIFNPVGLKKLPFIASSDFHKPKHIHSWKTLLYCEKTAEAIKRCIRINRDVSLTLYRDHRFGLDERPSLAEVPPQVAAIPAR